MDDQIDPGDNFFGINLSDCVTVPIMDSTVGLKAANAHLTRRVAELEAEKSRRDIIAQNITPVGSLQPLNAEASYAEQMEGLKGLPSLGAEAWFEIAMAYRAEIDDLTRQLAAQALAHAEQIRILQTRTYIAEGRVAELEGAANNLVIRLRDIWSPAMRVTPATQPTDAQQTASDVKAAPERRPDGTLKPVARAWEAPKRLTDVRRIGG